MICLRAGKTEPDCASQGHVLAVAFGLVMLGSKLVSSLMSQVKPSQGITVAASSTQLGFGLTTPVLLALYMAAMRTVYAYERDYAALESAD